MKHTDTTFGIPTATLEEMTLKILGAINGVKGSSLAEKMDYIRWSVKKAINTLSKQSNAASVSKSQLLTLSIVDGIQMYIEREHLTTLEKVTPYKVLKYLKTIDPT